MFFQIGSCECILVKDLPLSGNHVPNEQRSSLVDLPMSVAIDGSGRVVALFHDSSVTRGKLQHHATCDAIRSRN